MGISVSRRRFFARLYLALTLPLVLFALWGGWALLRQRGRPFVGVIWAVGTWNGEVYVDTYTPSYWPGIRYGLRGDDRLVSVNGEPAPTLWLQLASASPGTKIVLTVERDGDLHHFLVPVLLLTWADLLVPYGLSGLAGLIALGYGYWLVRTAREEVAIIAGYILFTMGMASLYVLQKRGITMFFDDTWLRIPLFIPAYPFLGALLFHLALIYPSPYAFLNRYPKVVNMLYLGALGMVALMSALLKVGPPYDPWAFHTVILLVCVGLVWVLARAVRDFLRPPSLRAQYTHSIALVLAIGLVLMVGVGAVPPFFHTMPLFVTRFVFPLLIGYPIMLAYAVRQTELVNFLRRQVEYHRALEDEAQELRRARETLLHEVADMLHDTLISDLRGLQLWLQAVRHRHTKGGHYLLSAEDLAFVERAIQQLYERTRAIMEGIKPVDFTQQPLSVALQYLANHIRRSRPKLTVELEMQFDDDECPPRVREAAYWIVHSALTNARDHANAERILVRVWAEEGNLHILVQDDGQGFDVQEVLQTEMVRGRRRLGIRNIYMRVQRLGGNVEITSDAKGTTVRVWLPLEEGTHDNDHSLSGG